MEEHKHTHSNRCECVTKRLVRMQCGWWRAELDLLWIESEMTFSSLSIIEMLMVWALCVYVMLLYEQESKKKKRVEMKVKLVAFIVDMRRLKMSLISVLQTHIQSKSPVGLNSIL